MKKFLAILALALMAAACDTRGTEPETPDGQEALGTYTFGDTEYEINYAWHEAGTSYHNFIFSPIGGEETKTTVIVFSLRNYWADGDTHNINDPRIPLSHNDDYVFVYEDLDWYYSQYRALSGGYFQVVELSADEYRVVIDVQLPDGTPFKMDFTHNYSDL